MRVMIVLVFCLFYLAKYKTNRKLVGGKLFVIRSLCPINYEFASLLPVFPTTYQGWADNPQRKASYSTQLGGRRAKIHLFASSFRGLIFKTYTNSSLRDLTPHLTARAGDSHALLHLPIGRKLYESCFLDLWGGGPAYGVKSIRS